jgi:hypothetical protein
MAISFEGGSWKLWTAVVVLLMITFWAPTRGQAFVLGLPGPLGNGGDAVTDQATVLYARRGGTLHRLAEVGPARDGLPKLLDLGFPFVADDGSVIFAGMVAENRRPRWLVFRADMQASPPRISRIQLPDSNGALADAILSADPSPEMDAQGEVIFSAQDADGKDAILLLSNGELSHLAKSGEETREGHRLHHIQFGSARSFGAGQVVFVGWLENHRQAELVASRAEGVRVIAVEGEAAVGGGIFQQGFGRPGVAPVQNSVERRRLAFSARTTAGQGIFVLAGRDGLRRVDLAEASCSASPVSFLSSGSPGLAVTGEIALLGWCSDVPVIIRVDDSGQARVSLRADSLQDQGGPLAIEDPWMLDSGAILFGGSAGDRGESIYELTTEGIAKELYHPYRDLWLTSDDAESRHPICTATIAANRHGDFAYLGETLPRD